MEGHFTGEPRHEKTRLMPMRKTERRRWLEQPNYLFLGLFALQRVLLLVFVTEIIPWLGVPPQCTVTYTRCIVIVVARIF